MTYLLSFVAGGKDANGNFLGGTEARAIVKHKGKLYAGIGYWEQTPPDGNAQVIVLAASGAWQQDVDFGKGQLAVGILHSWPAVELLVAGMWAQGTGKCWVWARDDATDTWTPYVLYEAPESQVRSFGQHTDAVTGEALLFAGTQPGGIYSATYVNGVLAWTQEQSLAGLGPWPNFPDLNVRVMGFAEAAGKMFATIGPTIWERTDGVTPSWKCVYTYNPGKSNPSQSGLRGLTAYNGLLMFTLEGTNSGLFSFDPHSGAVTEVVTFSTVLKPIFGVDPGYMIAAYNNMVSDGNGGLVFGFEANGVEQNAWAMDVSATWVATPFELPPALVSFPMVSTRTVCPSPFADEPGVFYFGGKDCNTEPANNTAWIVKGPLGS